jgi:hypothetical protein
MQINTMEINCYYQITFDRKNNILYNYYCGLVCLTFTWPKLLAKKCWRTQVVHAIPGKESAGSYNNQYIKKTLKSFYKKYVSQIFL